MAGTRKVSILRLPLKHARDEAAEPQTKAGTVSPKTAARTPRFYFIFGVILVLALALRLLVMLIAPYHGFVVDEIEYNGIAAMLNDGRGWAWFDHSIWVRTPLYPLFLTLLYKIFGPNAVAFRLVQIGLSLGTIVLFYRVAADLYGRRVGLWAMALLSIFWPFVTFPFFLLSENLFLPIFLAGFATIIRALAAYTQQASRRRIWAWALAAGLLFGLATLTRGQLLSFIPFVLLVPALLFTKQWRARFRSFLIISPFVLAGFLLVCAPWEIRNMQVYGRPFLETTAGYNFYLGTYGVRGEALVYKTLIAAPNQANRETLAYKLGLENLQADPGAFAAKRLDQVGKYWQLSFGAEENLISGYTRGTVPIAWLVLTLVLNDLLYLCIGVLCIIGLCFAPERYGARWLAVLLVAENMALAFVFFFSTTRVRQGIVFLLLIFAAWTLANIGEVWQRLRRPPRRVPALVLWALAPLLGIVFVVNVVPSILFSAYGSGIAATAARTHLDAGEALRLAGQPQASLAEYAQSDHNNPEIIIDQALADLQLGQTAAATTLFQSAAAGRTGTSPIVTGFVVRMQGDTKSARTAFNSPTLSQDPPTSLHWAWQSLAPLLAPKTSVMVDGVDDWGYIDNFQAVEHDGTATFRWTAGPGMEHPAAPRVRLRLPATATPQTVEIDLRGYRIPPLAAPVVEIWANGQKLGTVQSDIAQWKTASFTLPPGLVASAPLNPPADVGAPSAQTRDLIIEIRSPVFVADGGDDRRELGVQISRVAVK